ncbi:MAG: Cysteine desulfurase SufS [Firmicutes bacterium]|nr:Cysteine desulfurase SufS [candidate division NPL-UPA2 bacterium]
MRDIIYMDNAATSWPKAPEVAEAMAAFLTHGSGSPGRSGHALSLQASRAVFVCRSQLTELIGASDAARVVFTANATYALNMAIFGLLAPGDHCITTSMEHNAVIRPLRELSRRGVGLTILPCAGDGKLEAGAVRQAIKSTTKLVVLTHASNVCGTLLPIAEIAAITRVAQVLLLVDAAQTAGALPIAVESMGIDLLAAPGHKSLLGPTGTGFLYVRAGVEIAPTIYGGTGSFSELSEMPPLLPDRLESGTLNAVGIVGLSRALSYIAAQGVDAIREHEVRLATRLRSRLASILGVTLYGDGQGAPIVAFNIGSRGSTEVAHILDASFGIAVRAGLHCAPLAHETLGTLGQGIVRLSPGPFSTIEEIDEVAEAIERIAEERI